MQKIALITDSACDLDLNTLKENNINLLPLRIIYSNGDYRDRIDITPQEVYDNLENEVPKTSLPSAQETEEILTKLETEGYTHVICISISSGLSGSFNVFRTILCRQILYRIFNICLFCIRHSVNHHFQDHIFSFSHCNSSFHRLFFQETLIDSFSFSYRINSTSISRDHILHSRIISDHFRYGMKRSARCRYNIYSMLYCQIQYLSCFW